jgi:hypothetical protein
MEYVFFLNPKWWLLSRWRFCHFKFTLFSKNPLQAITNTKTKILMDLQAKKINMAPNTKMTANLEFLLKFYSHSMVYA